MADRRPWVVVLARQPVPGLVKTRLARGLGTVPAARWIRGELRRLPRLSDPRWRLLLAVTPDRSLHSRLWPPGVPRLAQGPGNLGCRIERLMRSLPPGPVLVVGDDVPELTRPHLARAIRLLATAEAVIGPAQHGGMWLFGLHRLRRVRRGLLEGIRWSTRYVQIDALIALADQRTVFADRLDDIDTVQDLKELKKRRLRARSR